MSKELELVYHQTIEIPSDCQVSLEDKTITVKGPKGTLKRSFSRATDNNQNQRK